MALSKFVLTSTVTIPPGTITTPVAGEPGSGGAAGYGSTSTSAGYGVFAQTLQQGQVIVLDPAGALFTAIGAGNLRSFTAAQETGGSLGVSNLTP